MSSPQERTFSEFIKIDRRKSDPVYLQIVYQFIRAVQIHLLQNGERIPGSRELSKDLKVHRKTVVKALEELRLQGWAYSIPSVGTYILNPEIVTKNGARIPVITSFAAKSTFSYKKSFILDPLYKKDSGTVEFTDGTPDYQIISATEVGRFYSSVIHRKNKRKTPAISSTYHQFFKQQLSFYVNTTRGFHSSVKNLFMTPNRSTLLYIITQLLINKGDTVLTGAYSSPFANMVFQQAGATLQPLPMDKEGIQVDSIRHHCKTASIRLLYVQPQHQYPTTVSLSAKRRQELTSLSKEFNFIIIEDGSFYELAYEKSNLIPLIKHKYGEQTLYLGSFGSYLLPGFQTSFLLGPEDFIAEAQKYLSIFGVSDPFKERALGEMIAEGDIHRFRRKALRVYKSRRDIFAELLHQYVPEVFDYVPPKGGLAFWLRLNPSLSVSTLAQNCIKEGLYIPRLCQYQNQEETALRLGFGHLNEKDMKDAVLRLQKGLQKLT